jgi:hypothetical protein
MYPQYIDCALHKRCGAVDVIACIESPRHEILVYNQLFFEFPGKNMEEICGHADHIVVRTFSNQLHPI